ncbi:hypothetical protein A2673_02175 [Candidatus Kaiserbacteria bacterium RIFCSPHIGHO2_01_FULL_50_13]|uniref:HTH arsR-type domain-containing protein n=1 Tax=Candidatus Kaiserbacteria bacterium RIFCSPLOWO2_01_FULL_50_24 TaxID=1798507 RepID=A0A1F6ER80_9BACT|nr:MAG: hypothetical protein A2673_02175 [Candidatus Kaiserbacteria bacterium RIFCSPHIGHO2_01_FULL_50_13]OGG76109.1 MAG: hypothetical protein A3A34_00795 [Candidatus Kaiserbacteria bacterium RIFCSPLOWO2_01_FULL_50_24]OGG82360.1 MAG: hypothetical protein A3H74_00125 [Candidatus Kaiserbacteria bacterium RIFCSPLOWO2_02_FULL_51_13]
MTHSNNIVATELVLKAMANRRRLAILALLTRKGRADVGSVADQIHLSFAATSRHLRTLANADLVESEQVNTTVYYSISKKRHPILDTTIKVVR